MTALRRHALVWLSQTPEADDESQRALADQWHAGGKPFVVCRRRGDRDGLALGFCAPHEETPELRPRRVAAHALAQHVVRVAQPPALEQVARCRPAADHGRSFARLGAGAARAGLDVRVFGSWMWQSLTGDRHVRPSSDLDVLIEVSGQRAADCAAAFLADEEPELPFKLDGELSFPGLGEVHWREYREGAPEILLKSVDTVRLIRREELPR